MTRIHWIILGAALLCGSAIVVACGDDDGGASCESSGDCEAGFYCGNEKACQQDCTKDSDCESSGMCLEELGVCTYSEGMNPEFPDSAPDSAPDAEPDSASDASPDA